jgi:GNAT superfamily N-acetyltransferase
MASIPCNGSQRQAILPGKLEHGSGCLRSFEFVDAGGAEVSSESNERCRQALISDVPSVARIHLEAFKGFFLAELGYRFLCVMYRAFLVNPAGIFVVHESKDGQITGFAVGALSNGQKDRWLALRFMPHFLWAALPAIFLCPRKIVTRLSSRFFETGSSFDVPNDASVLRSIGVLTSERGGGAASGLLGAFEQMALRQGAAHVYLTTDQDNNERAQNFYKRQGYSFVECFQQDGQRPMWLMSKLLKGVVDE